MRDRRLPLYLPPDLYDRLARQAEAEDREPVQHARYLLRRVLMASDGLDESECAQAPTGGRPAMPVLAANR